MKRQLAHNFDDIISIDNLLSAWREFIRGKRSKLDVQEFSLHLMDNILQLHADLTNKTYRHGPYQSFHVNDPKPREIHKAIVRDRLVHHAIYRVLYPFFHQTFIADSFSCQLTKGTHKALNRFRCFAYQVSKNNTHTCWVLKCDIKKFFASISHLILLDILKNRIPDKRIIWLLEQVIDSFYSTCPDVGLPLGNLTSQLLANIYLNEFDQFVKQQHKVTYYLRYADDFVILLDNRQQLETILPSLADFLWNHLRLTLHPQKVFIKTPTSGVDFLGWVHFADHRVLRTSTRHRMIRRLQKSFSTDNLNSYLGLLKHGNTSKIQRCVLDTARSRGIEVAG